MQEVEVKNTVVSKESLEDIRLAKTPKQMHFGYNGISVFVSALTHCLKQLYSREKPFTLDTKIHSRPTNLRTDIRKGSLTNRYAEPSMTHRTDFRSPMNQREIRFTIQETSLSNE